MVEEAAGTRMFEAKKQVAGKNLEKKNIKLQEMQKVIHFSLFFFDFIKIVSFSCSMKMLNQE